MPKINTIATVPVPKLSDKLVGTSVGGTPVNQTNNFTLQQLKTLFDGTPVSPNLQAVLNAGNTAIQNIYLTGTIAATNATIANDASSKNLYLSERLFDRNNFQGTNGQYLISTGTGVQWSTLTIATPTLQQVLTAGNISDKDIITTGNIQGANIQGTNVTVNSNLRVIGAIADSTNSFGTSGQVLSSTVTGTDWVDLPSYSAVSPLIYNNISRQFSIQQATGTQNGYLSSADWITFNGKQNAGNYITELTGEASALGPGAVNITLNNLAVINKTLTGLAISSGVITAADSIITAFGKIQGQINGIVAGVVYKGAWNAATNTPTLTSSVGVQGNYYVVDVAGNTNLNGITDWQVGDWAIYNGSVWQKVDNTDAVTSVNGQTGIVVLNSDDIAEGTTNLYYLDSRARAAISSVATGLTYISATGVFSLTAGYSIPTVANQTNWTTAYNDSIVSAAVTGTTTKTLTLTQQDGGTITASWTDIDTNLVTSVFGRTGAVVAQAGDYSTTLVTEGTNLYYLDSRARSAISSSATGLTYTTATGVFSFTAGYSIPTDASQSNWTTAYNDSITSAAVTGTTTKTLTLNQQDGGTITASWTDLDTGLTSVGVSMPSAFNVTNSPLTSNGTIAVTGAGTASQYVRGDGTLGDFPTGGGGGGASVSYYLNGSINQGTFGGNTYYQMSKTPILGTGTDFSTSTNGYIAQFITDVGTPDSLLIPGGNWNFETYFSASSGGGTPTFYIELYKYDGATFTLIASNSSNPELIAFGTTINPYYNSLAVPETVLTTNDRLAIRIYVFTSGRTITLHTEDNHLCQAITTFTTGLTALNGLTKQIQYFAVGTSGTDFNISSSVATHTFNLPTASATNRGALSSSDWSTFNAKQNALTLTTSGSSGPATLIGATLNIPDYGSALSGYVPYTGATTDVNIGLNVFKSNNSLLEGDGVSGGYIGFKQYSGTQGAGLGYSSISATGLTKFYFRAYQTGANVKSFNFDLSSITNLIERNYILPDADGTIALVGGSGVGTVTSVAALTLGTSGTDLSSTVANSTTTPVITLNVPTASATNRGALSASDWSTFNAKQNALTLTTTGTSGAATLIGATLNIPQYQAAGTYVNSVTASSPLASSGGVNPNITIQQATATQNGFLSSTDWSTFNNKQNTITLTTTGTSGAATLVGSTLNIPQYQSVLTNPITGTGTTNYLPKFTGSTTVGNSQVFDNGTFVGIGTGGSSVGNDFVSIFFNSSTARSQAINIKDTNASASGSTFEVYRKSDDTYLGNIRRNGTDDAIFVGGNSYLALGANNTEFARITSGGNLLVGTTTDNGARLQVSGQGFFTHPDTPIRLNNSGGTFTQLDFLNNGTQKGAIWWNNSNNTLNLWTGVTSLTLTSTGAATFSSSVTATNLLTTSMSGSAINIRGDESLNSNFGITWTTPTYNGGIAAIRVARRGASDASDMMFFTSPNGDLPNERMRIISSGNVLIGTTTDSGQRLQVNGAGGIRVNEDGSGTKVISIRSDFAGVDPAVNVATNNSLLLMTNNTERMRISSSGNVGIGTTSPVYKFVVSNSGATGLEFDPGTLISNRNLLISFNRSTSAYSQIQIDASLTILGNQGNVLIGTTTDNGARLQVSGSATIGGNLTVSSGNNLNMVTGDIHFQSNAGYGILSQNGNRLVSIQNGAFGVTGAATFSSSVTADSLLVQRTASRNMLGISSIALPTSGAEEGVAVVKTNSNLWQMSLVGYAVDSKGMRVYNTGGAGYTSFEVAQGAGTRFIVDGVGNVGIGTTNPAQRLSVAGEIAKYCTASGVDGNFENLIKYGFSSNLQSGTAEANRWIGIDATVTAGSAVTNTLRIRAYPGGFGNAAPVNVVDFRGDQSSFFYGNVGIGTSSPTNGLLVINSTAANGVRFALESSGTMNGVVALGNNAISGLATTDLALWTRGVMAFETGASGEKMRITSGGNVLMGTTTDNGNRLRVNGVGFFDSGIRTGQPVGTTTNNWLLGRALISGTSTPNRWIRVQIGLEYYDILAVYMGTL